MIYSCSYLYWILEIVKLACHAHVCLKSFYFFDNLMKFYNVHLAGPQCGAQYTSSEGVVTSPGFPSPYTHESECVWTITVPAGDTITLTFTTIDIEFESTCNYDFVEVIKRFLMLINCWDCIWRDLQDGRFAEKELSFKYKVCHFFLSFYTYIYTCIYINPSFIVIFFKSSVKIQGFNNADIQIQTQANLTYLRRFYFSLQVRDGPNEMSPLFNKFCGSTLPSPLTSTGNTMFIRFSSDHSQTGQGFRATWTTGKIN